MYDRFIQLIPSLFLPITITMHHLSGKKTGIHYTDFAHFAVCKNIRITGHKTLLLIQDMVGKIVSQQVLSLCAKKIFS
jgi:hypothetical protein